MTLLLLMNLDFAGGGGVVPPPSGTAQQVKFTLGTKEPADVTVTPTVGGKWSW